MKATLALLSVLASVAVAQTTTAAASANTGSSTSDCAADYIVEACLTSEQAKFDACNTNDWECKCAGQQAIATCYNNCPNDPRKSTADGQVTIFCGYASQYPSSTTKVASATSSSGSTSVSPSQTSDSASASGTSSGSSSTSSAAGKANAGVEMAVNAGGVLAAVFGVIAALI